ncbi:nuclear valosin-containing protein-like isoform X2 [Homalodisca vitripennis]|uniref:nuclear valosin-containing protein-like isoform X2 n=1 Tax=Homalodisca vitripennis TaxID=197043 RepID=UPI001EEBC012|nr:nuclear valosin-containing protein-like isoform X2 [Homalodisca vitripennis]
MNSFGKNKVLLSTPNQSRSFGPYGRGGNRNFVPQNGRPDRPNNDCRPYFSDQLILSRVAQYLQNTGKNAFIDFDLMVDDLQREFREYRRKKRSAFKHLLKKAVEVITFENALNQHGSVPIDEVDEDENGYAVERSPDYAFEGDGDVNSTLEDSYLQQNAKRRKTSDPGTQELISIVTSDEDDAEGNPAKAAEGKSSEPPPQRTELVPPEVSPVARPVGGETQTTKKRRAEARLASSKKFKTSLEPLRPSVSFKDIGGNEKVLQEVTQLLIHMRHPEVYRVLGVSPPRGFLLHGPPGSGKTLLAHAISGELKFPLLKVAAPELVGGLSGQSEERIRELFEEAVALAPCILFIDEVDAITPNRETAQREMERRIVAQLLSSMDELANNEKGDQVLVIGATNRPDSLDPALRRAGRFDREVCLGIPDRESRLSILQTLCHSLRLTPDLQLSEVAMMTPGYVGADLKSLVTESAMAAVNRLFKTLRVPDTKTSPAEVVQTTSSTSGETSNATALIVANEDAGQEATKKSEDSDKKPDNPEGATTEVEEMEVQVVPLDNEDTSDDVQVLDEQTSPPQGEERKSAEPEPEPEPEPKPETTPPSLLHSTPLTKEQLEEVYITMEDFRVALKSVQPSAKREGFATVPDVKWEDIGSLQDIRHDLEMAILAPVKFPQQFSQMGLHTPTGVLLCGPPGCGKTLLAKAVANEAGINFISVKGPELLNMYVGESERAVRQCFQRARSSQPCVIFFDEIDALCPKRTNMENGASRVVNQLLTEMDGVEARPGVFLMAATNRPDIVDPAVMRPGRLDKVLYVGLPAAEDRMDILRALTKGGKTPLLGEDVDLTEVARNPCCEGYSGADLAALVREASIEALKEFMASRDQNQDQMAGEIKVCGRHFTAALSKIRPSVSDRDKMRYEQLRLQYAAVPSKG